MCPTQADNSSRKLWLRCGCQFPWCALNRTEDYSPICPKRIRLYAVYQTRCSMGSLFDAELCASILFSTKHSIDILF
jgi:hypothetical protein